MTRRWLTGGLGVLLVAGLLSALPAGPAHAGARLCTYEPTGAKRVCVRVSTPTTTVGGQVIVSGRLGRSVRFDPSVRDGVCLYRVEKGQRVTTLRPDQRLPICTYQYGRGRYRIPAYLGVPGSHGYVVGPRQIIAGTAAIVSPVFVITTSG